MLSPWILPIESGRLRWQQRSSSATGVPSALRYSITLSSSSVRANGVWPTSVPQAAAYQQLRKYIGPSSVREDAVGDLLRRHDRGNIGIRPRHAWEERSVHHPQAADAAHPALVVGHRHRIAVRAH